MKGLAFVIAMMFLIGPARSQEAQTAPSSPFDDVQESRSTSVSMIGIVEGGMLPTSIDVNGLSGIASCCPNFSSGTGGVIGLRAGAAFGVLNWMSIEATLGASWSQPFTSAVEPEFFNDNFETVEGTIYHSITVNMVAIDLRASAVFALSQNLSVLFSPSYVLPVSSSYTQVERLEHPTTIEFINGSRNWNGSDGPLETTNGFLSLGGGVRYAFDLDGGWGIAPELSYHYSLSDFTPGWRVHRLLLGLAVIAP